MWNISFDEYENRVGVSRSIDNQVETHQESKNISGCYIFIFLKRYSFTIKNNNYLG